MDEINPYEPPASTSAADVVMVPETFAPDRCPDCGAAVTFWVTLRQRTPFRFKCGKCRAECRVLTPMFSVAFAAVVAVSILVFVAIILSLLRYGARALLLIIPSAAWWIALEIWTHRYIQANGRFERIQSGSRREPS